MAIDGTTLDVADTPANDRAFGRPTSHRGQGAFPQLRLVALIETGTHALCDAILQHLRLQQVPSRSQRDGPPPHSTPLAIRRQLARTLSLLYRCPRCDGPLRFAAPPR